MTFKRFRFLAFVVLACLFLVPRSTPAETSAPEPVPSLVSVLRGAKRAELCGERVPLENREVRERLEKELLLSLWDRPQVLLWLKRSRRHLPLIEDKLAEQSMPDDLKYVAIAESALRPHVGSPKGAIGFWQFTRETGRTYGLTIDGHRDERRNLSAATDAALDYFKDLYDMFGNWTLAIAAFNMGESGLMSEILLQGTRDYYRLYLPLETQRFVPRIVSVKMICSDPAAYGFHLSEEDYYRPLETEPVRVECLEATPIRVVAKAARTDFKVIKDLNPEIRGHYLPVGRHTLMVPEGAARDFDHRYSRLSEAHRSLQGRRVYVVKEGDNLSTIAEKFDIPLPVLIIQNRLDPHRPIHSGDRLIIFPEGPPPNPAPGDRKDR